MTGPLRELETAATLRPTIPPDLPINRRVLTESIGDRSTIRPPLHGGQKRRAGANWATYRRSEHATLCASG
eukprot:7848072-Lingulodinium_polyedra.AAC.1